MIPVPVQQALARGWNVLPLQKDKRPLLPTWRRLQRERVTEEEVIRWAGKNPPLWGVVTGKLSGVVVLDFDEPGVHPSDVVGLSPHVRTGSGGYHVYVEHPGLPVPTLTAVAREDLAGRWGRMDIRADGGYAAFHGSNCTGSYQLLKDLVPYPWADIPEALAGALLKTPQTANADDRVAVEALITRALKRLVERGGEGRNAAGFWLAVQLRDNGYKEAEARTVGESWVPSLPEVDTHGRHDPYRVEEWYATVRSAYKRVARKGWVPGFTEPEKTSPTPSRKRFQPYTLAAIREWPPIRWMVEGLFPVGGLILVYGNPGAGKSFLTLDISLTIASGVGTWHGMRCGAGPVVYVAGEGLSSLRSRSMAWESSGWASVENTPLSDVSRAMPESFAGVVDPPDLQKREELDAFIESIRPYHPSVVVFDTLARCFGAGDENQTKDMSLAVKHCDVIRSELQTTVLVVHHSAKNNETPRGSSALIGAADSIILVRSIEGGFTVSTTKQKDGEVRENFLRFRLEPVNLPGENSSCVIRRV